MIAARRVDAPVRRALGLGLGVAAVLTLLVAPVAAQTTTTSTSTGGGIKFGQPGVPIDISANSTQVFQQEGRVVYVGDVEAVQGTTRLRTPRLTLWYDTNKTPKPAPTQPRANSNPSSTIQRMEAEGTVYYVTDKQTAKGDHGSYLAADDTITLVGNVIVTQDKNVSTGDKLVIHQDTNIADMTVNKATGRVRGVFYNDKKDDGTKPATTAPGKPAPVAAR